MSMVRPEAFCDERSLKEGRAIGLGVRLVVREAMCVVSRWFFHAYRTFVISKVFLSLTDHAHRTAYVVSAFRIAMFWGYSVMALRPNILIRQYASCIKRFIHAYS